MRKMNWNQIEAKADGEFKRLPAGGYVCCIMKMEDVPGGEYIRMEYEIAEGEHKGFYMDDWGKSHPWSHSMVLSYKPSVEGMFKGRMEAIAKANPGFDPFAALDAERFDLFAGKLVGLVIGEEEYLNNEGEVRTSMKARRTCDIEDVRAGKVKAPEPKRLPEGERKGKGAPTAPAEAYAVDIPF